MENKLQCSKCGKRYHYEETAKLCCTNRGGCGKKETPNAVITHVCGETVRDGKWYFCRSCQRKKQNSWRTANIVYEKEDS